MKHLIAFFMCLIGTWGFSQFDATNVLDVEQTVVQTLETQWYLDSTYFYSKIAADWQLNDKIVIEERNDNGDETILIKYSAAADSSWRYTQITENTYHENNVQHTSLKRDWSSINWGDTVSYSIQNELGQSTEIIANASPNRRTLSFYENELLIKKEDHRRPNPFVSWAPYSNTFYTVNSNDDVISERIELYIDDVFVNATLDTIIYENENISTVFNYEWQNDSWILKSRTLYESEGVYDVTSVQNWNANGEAWNPVTQDKWHVDEVGVHERIKSNWNTSINDWLPSQRTQWSYDNDWHVQTTIENWDSSINDYKNFALLTYVRLDKDVIASTITSIWNGTNFDEKTLAILHWSEKDFAVATSEIIEKPFSISPNPTKGILNINGILDFEKAYIFSVDGKFMKSSSERSINISSFPTGAYIIRIDNVYNEQFIKK